MKSYNMLRTVSLFAVCFCLSVSCASHGVQNNRSVSSIDKVDSLQEHHLCTPRYTTIPFVTALAEGAQADLAAQVMDPEFGFMLPQEGIRNDSFTKDLRERCNYFEVYHLFLSRYEIYEKKLDDLYAEHSGEEVSLNDLGEGDLRKECQPHIDREFLEKVLPTKSRRSDAAILIWKFSECYNFYHDRDPNNILTTYSKGLDDFPQVVTTELIERFTADFWTWYDKSILVPQIDSLTKLHISDDVEFSEEEKEVRYRAVLTETDIDRRAILALEYVKTFDCGEELLGEIIESGIYTKYLPEVWMVWRTFIQSNYFGVSTYSVIPNSYYDGMKTMCINTILRHYQSNPKRNEYDLCLIENLIYCEIIHRQAGFGNSGLRLLFDYKKNYFIKDAE